MARCPRVGDPAKNLVIMPKKFDLKREVTSRGFGRYEFVDRYGEECSIQESSLATESAIWFGINAASIEASNLVESKGKKGALARMHLTQDMVRAILPVLTHFAATGELPPGREG